MTQSNRTWNLPYLPLSS